MDYLRVIQTAKGELIKVGRGEIVKTLYRSSKKDWTEFISYLKRKKIDIIKKDSSAATKSFYIEGANPDDTLFINVRFSNHTKPEDGKDYYSIVVKDSVMNGAIDIDANVLSRDDLKLLYDTLNSYL